MSSTAMAAMTVSEVWRYPLKSLGGERLASARVEGDGLVGDHMWALVDETTGTVASAKRARVWGHLLQCSARYRPGIDFADPASLLITTPDGEESAGDDPATFERLSALAGRPVHLQYASGQDPAGMTMEMEWAAETHEGMEAAIEYSSARAVQDPDAGVPVGAVPTGGGRGRYYDLAPLHVITTASVAMLNDDGLPIGTALRKYRPNIVVSGDPSVVPDDGGASIESAGPVDSGGDANPSSEGLGYIEDAWLSGSVRLGAVKIRPTIPVGRCVMVTLTHGDTPRDKFALRRIATRHRLDVGYGSAPQPTLGIYAEVARGGIVSVGDTVVPGTADRASVG